METIFNPRNIVVIGVSENPDNLAKNILENLINFEYEGSLFAVGQSAGEAHGIPIHTTLQALPDGIDLAVILTPASSVPDLIDACGEKGIRRVVIESGGFREYSKAGMRLENEVIERAQRWGIRFVGPNCISVINLETGVCLPFAPVSREAIRIGPASIIAQSGGISLTYLDRLCKAGVGVNKVVSIGNKSDYSEVDFLEYLLADPGTKMVCLYLESLEDGRRLMRLASQARKPVIVHKANRGQESQTIAFSHTAALADDDRIVDAAFRQSGILRTQNIRDTTSVAQGLVLPPVGGPRLVILSRSGGHAVTSADAAQNHGFQLMPIPERFSESVRIRFRADVIALTNPLDLGAIFDFDVYADIAEHAIQALSPDAMLLINTYGEGEAEAAKHLVKRVASIVHDRKFPIAICNYAQGGNVLNLQDGVDVPLFEEIEDAMRGLSASKWWYASRRIQQEFLCELGAETSIDPANADLTTIAAHNALRICESYGIPAAVFGTAHDPESSVLLARDIGLPVAVKILSEHALHKSDIGGVELGLAEEQSVRAAVTRLAKVASRFEKTQTPPVFMVQEMVNGGIEVILGVKRDPTFGPVVMFGLGGTLTEVMGDVSFRVAPLTGQEAGAMIDELRGSALLKGARGSKALNRTALVEAMLSFSQILFDRPELLELEINPLIVLEDKIVAVDARGTAIALPV